MQEPSLSCESLSLSNEILQKKFFHLKKKHSKLLQFLEKEKKLNSFLQQEIESLKTYKSSLLEENRSLLKENGKLKQDAKTMEKKMKCEKQGKYDRLKNKKNQCMFLLHQTKLILDEYQNTFEQVEESHFDFEKLTFFLKNKIKPSSIIEFPSFKKSFLPFSPNLFISDKFFPSSPLSSFEEKKDDSRTEEDTITHQNGREENEKKGKRERERGRKEEEERRNKENKKGRNEVGGRRVDGRREEEGIRRREDEEKEKGHCKLADLASQIFSSELSLTLNLKTLARLSINSFHWEEIHRKKQEIQVAPQRLSQIESFSEQSVLKMIEKSWMSVGRMEDESKESLLKIIDESWMYNGRMREEGGRREEETESFMKGSLLKIIDESWMSVGKLEDEEGGESSEEGGRKEKRGGRAEKGGERLVEKGRERENKEGWREEEKQGRAEKKEGIMEKGRGKVRVKEDEEIKRQEEESSSFLFAINDESSISDSTCRLEDEEEERLKERSNSVLNTFDESWNSDEGWKARRKE